LAELPSSIGRGAGGEGKLRTAVFFRMSARPPEPGVYWIGAFKAVIATNQLGAAKVYALETG